MWMFLLSYIKITAVPLVSMFVDELPKSQMRRCDRKEKEHVEISCPAVVSVYNSHMGNVDCPTVI